MIALMKVKEVQRLLAEGKMSQRSIAKATGISRASVGAIASGKRPDYEARVLMQEDKDEPSGPLARCPECGGMVYTPCRLCRLRKMKALEQEIIRAFRRRARELALKKLVAAVWKASQQRDEAPRTSDHLPAAGPSDCR